MVLSAVPGAWRQIRAPSRVSGDGSTAPSAGLDGADIEQVGDQLPETASDQCHPQTFAPELLGSAFHARGNALFAVTSTKTCELRFLTYSNSVFEVQRRPDRHLVSE